MGRFAFVVSFVLLVTCPAFAGPVRASVAFVWETGRSRGFSALLGLEIPLERLAAPRLPRGSAVLLAEDSAQAADAVDAEEPPARAGREQRAVPNVPALDPAFARDLVREALRVRGQSAARGRLDGLAGRSRSAALLPALTLRAARSTDQTLRLSPSGFERYELTQAGGTDLLFEARATWNLDRLVFASEELRVEHLRQQHAEAMDRLVLGVLKHLFVWQRARARLAAGDLDPESELALALDAFEAELALDVLTEGFFSRHRRRAEGGALRATEARREPAEGPGSGYFGKTE